jgi:2-iminobutanoate/2-iminopropanoate deaminase
MSKAASTPKKSYGPYSLIRESGPLVFVAGQVGINPEDGSTHPEVGPQTTQALKNVAAALGTVGLGLEHVVDATVFVTDMGDFGAVSEAYAAAFTEPYPTRACVAVAELPRVAAVPLLVEVKVIAARPA